MKAGIIMILLLIIGSNFYVAWRIYQIFPVAWMKIIVPTVYVLTLLTYIVSFIMMLGHEQIWPIKVNTALSPILVIYLYSLLAFLILDLGRLTRLIPQDFCVNSLTGSVIVFGTIAFLLTIGAVNCRNKHRESIEITTDKFLEKSLKVVMISDLHLGYNNSRKELARWIDLINAEHPDLVIFGGDIIDVSTEPLFKDNFAAEFHRLEAPTYAAFGNHEFISGVDDAMKFYHDAGIIVLRDSVIEAKGVTIIGRDDLYANHNVRLPLSELTKDLQKEEFTILIDHQPYHLEEAEAAKIDFQFSGHTHRGQVWPISLITDLMYEKSWGIHQKGSTTYYISSGLGIWGPKFRLGSRSEYIVMTINSL